MTGAAAPLPPPAEVLLSKRVQEMVLNGEDPPAPYMSRDDEATEDDYSNESPIPVVNIGIFSSSTPSADEYMEELQKLKSALQSWGCFQAIGHGISRSFLDKIVEVTREFFELPMEEKKKYSKTVAEFEGYGADPTPEDGQSLDWSDRLFLDVYPEDCIKLKFWPQNPVSFRKILLEYTEKMKKVTELTSKAMAKSLYLDENCFLKQFGERATLQARFNYYSKCQKPERILGLKPHADGSGYTLILQERVGLQVFYKGRWYTVPQVPGAVFILMGDQMEIMTNGEFKSPVHRVLSHSERDRISIAMFYTPAKGKDIGPEEGLVNDEKPRLFKQVKDYADVHFEYYQKGERALHVAQA
ncbi:Leucocyanidin oxygenase [Bertholletia excelsa]